MSKVLLLSNPILTTSLIYPMAATENYIQSPYIMISRVFSLLHCAVSFWSVKDNNCAPCAMPSCIFLHHIFPLVAGGMNWYGVYANSVSMATNTVAQPHYFFLLLVGRCFNRRLDSMYVSLVTWYESTKPPARVCCEIFINMRWKTNQNYKEAFFLVRRDLRLLLSS